MGPLPVIPKVDLTVCTLCGLCVSTCPEEAVFIDAPFLLEKRQWLHENCANRKEPELYY